MTLERKAVIYGRWVTNFEEVRLRSRSQIWISDLS